MRIKLIKNITLHKPLKKGTDLHVSNELGLKLIKEKKARKFRTGWTLKKTEVKFNTKDEHLNK